MIARLKGICLEKTPTSLLLDLNGVGYEITITLQCYQSIGNVDEEVIVYTHMAVSEHDISLYGFGSSEEKEMFRYLIAVNGIGPKLSIAILSGIPVVELKQAIAFGDISRLNAVSGIGRKTAERMIVELKDKLGSMEIDFRKPQKLVSTTPISSIPTKETPNDRAKEAILALISLGYKKPTAEKSVKTALQEDPFLTVQELIKHSLRTV